LIAAVVAVFLVVNKFLNWNAILNADVSVVSNNELSILATIVFTFFCINFVLVLITTILTADQKPALASLFDMVGRLLSLIVIFILTKTTKGSLLYLGVVYSSMPVIVLCASSIFFFNRKYKQYRPSIKSVDFNQAPQLLNIGVKFFIIQITVIIFYQTNAIIIAQMFRPGEVTVYTVTYQYFNVFTSVFSIILSPYWSAFTDSYIKKDFEWIRKSISKLKKLALLMILLLGIALLANKFFFSIWIGDKVKVNFGLSLAILIFMGLSMFNNVNCHFINGVGKIKIQLCVALLFSLIHIPLALFFCSKFGISGIMYSPILNALTTLGIYEIQYRKIIDSKAFGIWNK
jgi:O-antigen/teichoic acid export membrane protein